MIYLSKQNPLGTGRHRKCYAHPEDAQRCIKIVYHTGSGGDKEIRRDNNAEFYDNVIAGNFPDRFSGGNNPVPCHADLLAKAINPSGLAFGQLRCIRGKMRHIQTFH